MSELQSASVCVRVPMDDQRVVSTVYRALLPETWSAPSDRAVASLRCEADELVIDISASDLAALRAAMNSYLSWVSACLGVLDLVTPPDMGPGVS